MRDTRFESQYPKDAMRDEVGKTLEFIARGNFVQAVGLPGTGKSTLLRLIAYNSQVREKHLGQKDGAYHFVYLNFVEVAKRNLRDVTKYMLLSLHSSLSERGVEETSYVQNKLSESLKLNDEMVYFQNLKLCVEHLSGQGYKTVFLMDRLEIYFPYMDERFFANLRILRNSAKYSFSVVFSLNRPLDMSLGQEAVGEIYDLLAGNTVFVGLHHAEGLAFRMRHIEEVVGKKCPDHVKQELIELTGGHGKMTKIGYEALLSEGCAQKDISDFLLRRRQVRGALDEVWNYFTLEEQQVLLDRQENGEIEKFLTSLGILQKGNITIPLFRKYLEDKKADNEVISYNGEKRAILRGGVDISEMFSSSEFLLLQYLLEHRGQVITRDELIAHVWGGLASQEGVTPQAFDQLVYRVRKKIEGDPRNPKQLLTIKGRGYKFV